MVRMLTPEEFWLDQSDPNPFSASIDLFTSHKPLPKECVVGRHYKA